MNDEDKFHTDAGVSKPPDIPCQQKSRISVVPTKDIRHPVSRSRFSDPVEPVKLSILMPAYNEQHTIVQAITEVLDRDYPCGIELIVVDDGSTDQTGALLSRIQDPRLVMCRFSANRGKGAA